MKVLWATIVGLFALGCAGATDDQLRTRAAFDLKCDAAAIQIIPIDDRTRGVRGCDQQGTYVESCDGPKQNAGTSCTWVLNTDSRKSQ